MKIESLYYYTSVEIAIKIINKGDLKLSFSPTVNDPFDLGKDIIYDPDDKDGGMLHKAIREDAYFQKEKPQFMRASQQELLKIVNKYIKESSIHKVISNTPFMCFSKKNNIPLMWAHYGDKFKGVVLEFSVNSISFGKAQEIIYAEFDKLPSIITRKRMINFLKRDANENRKFTEDLLIKKHSSWSYEEEWRVIGNPKIKYLLRDGMQFFPYVKV